MTRRMFSVQDRHMTTQRFMIANSSHHTLTYEAPVHGPHKSPWPHLDHDLYNQMEAGLISARTALAIQAERGDNGGMES